MDNPDFYMNSLVIGHPVTRETYKRPWIAAALAVVYPGLGHVYLRAWGRSLMWFGAVIGTAIILIPTNLLTSITALADIPPTIAAVPIEAAIAVGLVVSLNVIDAWVSARRQNVPEDGQQCPRCGRTTDLELSFCHWCTTEFTTDEPDVTSQ